MSWSPNRRSPAIPRCVAPNDPAIGMVASLPDPVGLQEVGFGPVWAAISDNCHDPLCMAERRVGREGANLPRTVRASTPHPWNTLKAAPCRIHQLGYVLVLQLGDSPQPGRTIQGLLTLRAQFRIVNSRRNGAPQCESDSAAHWVGQCHHGLPTRYHFDGTARFS